MPNLPNLVRDQQPGETLFRLQIVLPEFVSIDPGLPLQAPAPLAERETNGIRVEETRAGPPRTSQIGATEIGVRSQWRLERREAGPACFWKLRGL